MLSRSFSKPYLCRACQRSVLRSSSVVSGRRLLGRDARTRSPKRSDSVRSREDVEASIRGEVLVKINTPKPLTQVSSRQPGDWKRPWNEAPGSQTEATPRPTFSQKDAVAPGEEDDLDLDDDLLFETDASVKGAEDGTTETSSDAIPLRSVENAFVRHERLNIDALGQPIEAIIFKNPAHLKKTRKLQPKLEVAETAKDELDWDELVESKERHESEFSEVVWKNIEQFRPADATTIRRKDFDNIVTTLVAGFTKNQLAHYCSLKGSSGSPSEKTKTPYPWLVKQSEWVPDDAVHWGNTTPKQQHAISIVRDVWGLGIQEHEGGLGTTMIWTRPEVFPLFSGPSSSTLASLEAEILNEDANESVTAVRSESRLEIHSPKASAIVFLSRLNEIVQNMVSRKVSAKGLRIENLDRKVLESLESVTNTSIQYHKRQAELEVSWLVNDDRPPPMLPNDAQEENTLRVEDPADNALRLLRANPSCSSLGQALQIITRSGSSKNIKADFVEYRRERRSMSWRDQLRPWSRYVFPVGQGSGNPTKRLSLDDRIALSSSAPEDPSGKANDRVIATFGHILHTQRDTQQDKMAAGRRILAPITLHPASLTGIEGDDKATPIQEKAIILKFLPKQAFGRTVTSPPPEVQLRLPIGHESDLANFTIPAETTLIGLVNWHVSDILLPEESVDVQLSQQRLVPLDIKQKSIQAFLAASEFDLLKGHLRTPDHTTISIPQAYAQTSAKGVKDNGNAHVPYFFAGLEIHQSVELPWYGHVLRYNSIEAGAHGGQRQELSLVAQPSADNSELTKEQQKGFLQSIEAIATGQQFPWDGGYNFVETQPFEELDFGYSDDPPNQSSDAAVDPTQEAEDAQLDDALLEATKEYLDETSSKGDEAEELSTEWWQEDSAVKESVSRDASDDWPVKEVHKDGNKSSQKDEDGMW
ncbi:hypothetical protein S40285_02463 [Stachybotrys chlorohalonatus IBT 40285]|uniref:Uncharacterized protein n=1 Tax=Stachybotrys chlorohalonatus (strain IBT 40285) TaxID=1283841 RepID=A0A084R0Q1_STAC4|nr:hypothetical protein S40285_02463 [Stachybotrys chlorohalonata IBT 40285]